MAERALIVGGTGQDGSLIAHQLIAAGVDVHATGRDFASAANVPTWRALDIQHAVDGHRLDPSAAHEIRLLLDRLKPTMIFCLAGQSSVGRSFAIPGQTIHSHVDPVVNIATAMRDLRLDCHLVVAASGEVFGETTMDKPAKEDSLFAPRNPYAVGKAMAALAARGFRDSFDMCVSIAYLYNHESPLRPVDFLFGKVLAGISDIRSGQIDHIALGNGDVARDWGWAPDYAAAMIRMAMQPEAHELILASGHTMKLRDAVESLVTAAGLDADRVIRWQAPAAMRTGEAQVMAANPSRAREVLDWSGSASFPDLAERLLSQDFAPSCR